MAPLWSASSAAAWAATWTRYDAVLASLQKDTLVGLDEWFRIRLPEQLHARDPAPFITHAELTKLMEWKLKKGKWRPQLMKFIQGLTPEEVQEASSEALKALRDGQLKAAVEALSVLKGVGPATASAVLAAYDPSVPFMGDEALEAVAKIIGPRKYTLSHYLSFVEQMKAKASWLKQELGGEDGGDEETDSWTAQRVQLCLYAAAHDHKKPAEPKKKATVKRKADTYATRENEDDSDGKQLEPKEEETPRALRMRRRAS